MFFILLVLPIRLYGNGSDYMGEIQFYKGNGNIFPAKTVSGINFHRDINIFLFDKLEISENSRCEIDFIDNTIVRTMGNTILETDYDGIYFKKGTIWVSSINSSFRVKCKNIVVDMGNGEIIIESNDDLIDSFSIYVLKGKVYVSDSSMKKFKLIKIGNQIESNQTNNIFLYKINPFNIHRIEKKLKNFWGKKWLFNKPIDDLSLRTIATKKLHRLCRIEDKLYKREFSKKIFLNTYRNFKRIFRIKGSRRNLDNLMNRNRPERPNSIKFKKRLNRLFSND